MQSSFAPLPGTERHRECSVCASPPLVIPLQVVFKALIVLHTIIRNGATDNVLQYLSSSDVLKLRNVSSGNWEGERIATPDHNRSSSHVRGSGYNAPQNLQNYSKYLDTRIRAYRELKHDAIRVQSETNRDLRNSQAIEEELDHGPRKRSKNTPAPSSTLQRSKTTAGRKLRVMTVEKGLLRETKVVQKMVDALVETRVRFPYRRVPYWYINECTVLSRQSRGRAKHHGTPNARQGSPHPLPSLQRRRDQRTRTLLRDVAN